MNDIAITKVDNKIETKDENAETETKELQKLILDGDWRRVYHKLKDRNALTEIIDSDGNTILHIAAIVGDTYIVEYAPQNQKNLLRIIDNEGKTPLDKAYENMHLDIIAYLEGATKDDEICKKGAKTETKELQQLTADRDWYAEASKKAAEKEPNKLQQQVEDKDWVGVYLELEKRNKKGQTPLDKAYENMHLDMIAHLLDATEKDKKESHEAANVDGKVQTATDVDGTSSVEIGVDLLVNAISAKRYGEYSILLISFFLF
ncbi:hypothetical protein L1987_54269 [Smallanthus sonchifolius]|uniref:Uncharacterized protein n=1 Tax=Smallanthus sonchifolius TaxID=185202 RepID=A0ACB9E6J8_9ASTR|nr:hypothetical protein L1987_54269 [Smallanthus sonchifolius]